MVDIKKETQKAELLGSLLLFTQVFYKLRTGREFVISEPIGRESHHIQISRALTSTQRGEVNRLLIHCPPRYGKTELCIHYVAWCIAQYPDSNFLYVSYSKTLAKKQTQTIREIINNPLYKKLFDVSISDESSAKDDFMTDKGGSVVAAGAGGTITGRGAGIQTVNRFGGAIIIDDIHKPSEVTSDTMRQSINDWYLNTLQSRVNSPIAPIIFIGQRLHEDDLPSHLAQGDSQEKDKGFDGYNWTKLILPALDGSKNALHPTMHTREKLLEMQEIMPYDFASQYQQNPQPAGGGIFKSDWWPLLNEIPEILATFITADTAETQHNYNDATVFTFFGIYKIIQDGVDVEMMGLHILDCVELWCQPKDLESEFLSFYSECLRFHVKPKLAAIEIKSTGTTLLSTMKSRQGLYVHEIARTVNSSNKTRRFLNAQPYVASKRVSLTANQLYTKLVIEHMKKITNNETHRRDDIADTIADGIQLGLVDKIVNIPNNNLQQNETLKRYEQVTRRQMNTSIKSWQ